MFWQTTAEVGITHIMFLFFRIWWEIFSPIYSDGRNTNTAIKN
jgi:hypothetical protein